MTTVTTCYHRQFQRTYFEIDPRYHEYADDITWASTANHPIIQDKTFCLVRVLLQAQRGVHGVCTTSSGGQNGVKGSLGNVDISSVNETFLESSVTNCEVNICG